VILSDYSDASRRLRGPQGALLAWHNSSLATDTLAYMIFAQPGLGRYGVSPSRE
jgi:hypothetical protein